MADERERVATRGDETGAETEPWHALTEADVLRELDTRLEGLSWDEARSRLVRNGPNRLPATRGPSALALLA